MPESKSVDIDDKLRNHIRNVVELHYGFIPTDAQIDRVDKGLRGSYVTLHPYRIVNRLATSTINEIILKYRDEMGIKLEEIELDKLIFRYKTLATMCFNEGIPHATICLCRTAIEAGLRERIAEELAKKDIGEKNNISDRTFEKMKELRKVTLGRPNGGLLKLAEDNRIVSKENLEELFRTRFGSKIGRKILDKFIHGDIFAIYDFLQERGVDTRLIGAKDRLDERKIIADMVSAEVAFEILMIITKLSEILYLK